MQDNTSQDKYFDALTDTLAILYGQQAMYPAADLAIDSLEDGEDADRTVTVAPSSHRYSFFSKSVANFAAEDSLNQDGDEASALKKGEELQEERGRKSERYSDHQKRKSGGESSKKKGGRGR